MKRIIPALMLVLCILLLGGCGKSENGKTENNHTSSYISDDKSVNFLTGEKTDESSGFIPRPVAVTVNNIIDSLPQYGLSEADILTEMPVEGGITRLMALYSDYRKVPSVCSVRSCRYYFPVFAMGFDAVYFCFGSNETLATPFLESSGIDYIDGNRIYSGELFYRDEQRLETYSSEHTVYISGRELETVFENYGFRKKLDTSKGKTAFPFSDAEIKGDAVCGKISAVFSQSYYSTFSYDEARGTFFKTHGEQPHIDSVSGRQLEFENVFILYADKGLYGSTNLVELDWHEGKGVYATKGTVQKISWKKESESSPLEFFDASGEKLQLNKGRSYIGVGVDEITL